jgi:hypothetical protein
VIYDLGRLGALPLKFAKAQAQHFAFAYAFAMGIDTPSAWSTGYEHLLSLSQEIEPPAFPGFSGAARFGKTIGKRRLASLFVDQVKASFKKDAWAALDVSTKGTGKYEDTVTEESVTANYNATSLTLAANGVQGSSAAERMDSVHLIRVQVPATGEWVDVVFTAVSGATPAVITINAPGGTATSTTYKIIYAPTEPAWGTFPARVIEPALRVTDLVVKLGGKWNGSAFVGGHDVSNQISSLEHTYKNSLVVEFVPGAGGQYANRVIRTGREQTIVVDKDFKDWILERMMISNEYLGMYVKCTGDLFEAGHNYYAEMVLPRIGVLKKPIGVNNNIYNEKPELAVLQDDIYGSLLVKVGNKVAAYAG